MDPIVRRRPHGERGQQPEHRQTGGQEPDPAPPAHGPTSPTSAMTARRNASGSTPSAPSSSPAAPR